MFCYLFLFAFPAIVDVRRCLFLHSPISIVCLFILQTNERCYLMKRVTDTVTHVLHDLKNPNPNFLEVIYFFAELTRELRDCVSIIRIVYWQTLSPVRIQTISLQMMVGGKGNASLEKTSNGFYLFSIPCSQLFSNRPLLFLSWMISNYK